MYMKTPKDDINGTASMKDDFLRRFSKLRTERKQASRDGGFVFEPLVVEAQHNPNDAHNILMPEQQKGIPGTTEALLDGKQAVEKLTNQKPLPGRTKGQPNAEVNPTGGGGLNTQTMGPPEKNFFDSAIPNNNPLGADEDVTTESQLSDRQTSELEQKVLNPEEAKKSRSPIPTEWISLNKQRQKKAPNPYQPGVTKGKGR